MGKHLFPQGMPTTDMTLTKVLHKETINAAGKGFIHFNIAPHITTIVTTQYPVPFFGWMFMRPVVSTQLDAHVANGYEITPKFKGVVPVDLIGDITNKSCAAVGLKTVLPFGINLNIPAVSGAVNAMATMVKTMCADFIDVFDVSVCGHEIHLPEPAKDYAKKMCDAVEFGFDKILGHLPRFPDFEAN